MFAGEESRTVDWWGAKELPEPYVRSVSGRRMVLFLKKASTPNDESGPDTTPWLPASYYNEGGFKVAVAWIERGEVYAYQQVINPGPSRLVRLGTAVGMKASVASFVVIESDLQRAAEQRDPIRAAQAFRAFVRHSFPTGAGRSLRALGKMNEQALPVLRQQLADRGIRHWHPEIIAAMVKAGGNAAGQDLTKVVQEELEYWTECAPDLEAGWWNSDPAKTRKARQQHYSRLLEALRKLRSLDYPQCLGVVAKTRELWESIPALGKVGDSQMIEACDKLVAHVSVSSTDP